MGGGYIIESFLQANDPVSVVSGDVLLKEFSPENDPDAIEILNMVPVNFMKRCYQVGWRRETFSYMAESQSDWLIIDSGAIKYNLLRFKENNAYIALINDEIIQKMIQKGFFRSETEMVKLSDMEESEFNYYMEKYCSKILDQYDEEKIIINDLYPALFAINGEKIESFDYNTVKRFRTNVKRGFEFFKNRFPKAHIIEIPYGVIADMQHKWGVSTMHYIPEYYDYGLEAVNIITQNNFSFDEEKKQLFELKNKYEKVIHDKYEHVFLEMIESFNNQCSTLKSDLYNHPYLKNYVTARIDIKNYGDEKNDLKILEISDTEADIQSPRWFCKSGFGYVIQSDCGCLRIKFKCIDNGVLKIFLRGADVKDCNGKRIPFKIDFTSMHINGDTIFTEPRSIWHDQPFIYQHDVKDGDVLFLVLSWTVHDETKTTCLY